MELSANTLLHWYNAYCLEVSEDTDRHQLFATCQGIPREEAKVLCYKIAYMVSGSEVIKCYK